MAIVTVLTPTYNRSKELIRLYKSLCEQDNKDFIWLVVDDGSTDNTEAVINQWLSESVIDMRYIKKENGGKHTALNYAYQYINTELTFIVDSDDWLTPDAVSVIEERYNKHKFENDLCGISFLRGKPNGGYLSSGVIPYDGLKESFTECRINRNIKGDMAEVWYTKCLKQYPFPEFKGEKFIGEDIVWVKMANKYKMRFYNDVIYISDYQDDGLTKNRRVHNINSPHGCVERSLVFLDANINIKARVKAMLQYIIYGHFEKMPKSQQIQKIRNKGLYVLLFVPAEMIYLFWKVKYISTVLQR